VVTSQTSIEIQRHLDEFNLDVGVTYLDNEPLARVRTLPLYQERYVLLTRPEGVFLGRNVISWSEAASLPLCLLTPDMQNRRILDMHFHEAGAVKFDPQHAKRSDCLDNARARLLDGQHCRAIWAPAALWCRV
jgi:LysR substrate binding domain